MEEKIPEINIQLTSMVVKSGVKGFGTIGDWYANANLFGKIKYLWYWYWHVSEKQSWGDYLKKKGTITWEPELAQDVSTFDNLYAEVELTALLKTHYKKK